MRFVAESSGGSDRPRREFRGLPFADSTAVGDWLEARLDPMCLHGHVPSGYEAYGQIFHPAYREIADRERASILAPSVRDREVRWAEVAVANGRVTHPTMEWEFITGAHAYRWQGSQPGIWDTGPSHGSLPHRQAIELCELLAIHTATPDQCFFGVSWIYGDLPDFLRRAPVVQAAHMVSGPLAAAASVSFDASSNDFWSYRAPNLWWPEDQAWCVSQVPRGGVGVRRSPRR